MDVIAIRARRLKHRIAYRFVDEYENVIAKNYEMQPKTSTRPLTLGWDVPPYVDWKGRVMAPAAARS